MRIRLWLLAGVTVNHSSSGCTVRQSLIRFAEIIIVLALAVNEAILLNLRIKSFAVFEPVITLAN